MFSVTLFRLKRNKCDCVLTIILELYNKTCLPTIDSECDAAFSCKGIICDGDLHVVSSIIRESQVMEKQSPILKYQDAVSILRPQGPNDVSSNRLDNSDRLFPLELPLDDRQVEAETTVVDGQNGLPSHGTSNESVGDGHIHCQHPTCRETHNRGSHIMAMAGGIRYLGCPSVRL